MARSSGRFQVVAFECLPDAERLLSRSTSSPPRTSRALLPAALATLRRCSLDADDLHVPTSARRPLLSSTGRAPRSLPSSATPQHPRSTCTALPGGNRSFSLCRSDGATGRALSSIRHPRSRLAAIDRASPVRARLSLPASDILADDQRQRQVGMDFTERIVNAVCTATTSPRRA